MAHKYGFCRFTSINKRGESFKCNGEVHFPKEVNSNTIRYCKICKKPHAFGDYYESELLEDTTPYWLWKLINSEQVEPKNGKSTTTQQTRNEDNEKTIFNRLNFLYFGAFVFALTLICYFFKWKIPLFESYSAAFLFSAIILTCAGFYYYICDKKYFASFGILFLMGGVIGMWQYGPSDVYLIPIFSGIYLLIVAFIPALIGIPLLLGGAYYLIASIYQAFRFGISYIEWYYWPASIASILIGLWLLKRQKKLNK